MCTAIPACRFRRSTWSWGSRMQKSPRWSCRLTGTTYSIYGENFTKQSKVYINGEKQSTTFLNNTRLDLKESEIQAGDTVMVAQVGSSNTIFRESKTYEYNKRNPDRASGRSGSAAERPAGICRTGRRTGRMTYREAEEYILEIPKFTKKNDAVHTKTFLKYLGNPQEDLK